MKDFIILLMLYTILFICGWRVGKWIHYTYLTPNQVENTSPQ